MARLLGINHVALEVGDLDAALALYGRLFGFELRGARAGAAFIDMGDQFLALSEGRAQGPDDGRHFGLVVDDKEAVRAAVEAEGLELGRHRPRGSTSSTRGATASRSSPTPTSSSSARPASSASSASRGWRRPSGPARRSPSAASPEAVPAAKLSHSGPWEIRAPRAICGAARDVDPNLGLDAGMDEEPGHDGPRAALAATAIDGRRRRTPRR